MNGQHTPGPWVIATPTQGYEVCTIHGVENQPTEDGLGQRWVYVRPETLFRDGEWHWPDAQEQTANARLIAAAPDLLEALECLEIAATGSGVPHPQERKLLHDAILAARAAIAKATGAA